MKDLTIEEKIEFFQWLILHGDDLSKIAFIWISCSNKSYIRPKLEQAFQQDLEDWCYSFRRERRKQLDGITKL